MHELLTCFTQRASASMALFLSLVIVTSRLANMRSVPLGHPTVCGAIDSAFCEGTVLVEAGTY